MKFEKIENHLAGYKQHNRLNMEQMLALFCSLEEDLSANGKMAKYQLSAEECQSYNLIGELVWLGNLFSSLYNNNKTVVDENTSGISQKRMNAALAAKQMLQEQLEELDKAEELEEKNAELKKRLEDYSDKLKNIDSVKEEFRSLQKQCKEKDEELAELTSFNLSDTRMYLQELTQKVEVKKQENFEQQDECNKIESELNQKLIFLNKQAEDIAHQNDSLKEKLQKKQEELEKAINSKEQEKQRLSNLPAEIEKINSEIANLYQENEEKHRTYEEKYKELLRLKNENEDFCKDYLSPLTNDVKELEESLEQSKNVKECFETQKKDLQTEIDIEQNEIDILNKEIIKLNNDKVVLATKKKTTEDALSERKEDLQKLQNDTDTASDELKKTKDYIQKLKSQQIDINTTISTAKAQDIPQLENELMELNEQNDELSATISSLKDQKHILQNENTDKEAECEEITNSYNEEREKRTLLENEVAGKRKDLDAIIVEIQELQKRVDENDLGKLEEEYNKRKEVLKQKIDQNLEKQDLIDKQSIELKNVEDNAEKLSTEGAELADKIEEAKTKCQQLNEQVQRLQNEYQLLNTKQARDKLNDLNERFKFLHTIGQNLDNLANKLPRDPVHPDFHNQVDKLDNLLQNSKLQMDQVQGIIKQLQTYFKEGNII